jgi:hypothetical protein
VLVAVVACVLPEILALTLATQAAEDEDAPAVPWEAPPQNPPLPKGAKRQPEAPPSTAPGAPTAAGDPDPDRDGRGEQTAVESRRSFRVRFVDRPLTVPHDWFALDAGLGYERLDPSSPVVSLATGAVYGVSDDLQIGVELLRLTMSPNPTTGLGQPHVSVLYRMLKGTFELGGAMEMGVPTGGQHEGALSVLSLLHIASFARIDLAPSILGGDQPSWRFSVLVPASLRIQVIDQLSLGVDPILSIPDVRRGDVLARLGGRASFTVADEHGARADIDLLVTSADRVLRGSRPADPAFGNYFSVFVLAKFFVSNPYDEWGFDRDEHW